MDVTMGRDIIRRWPDNPIIALQDLPRRSSDIWNAGIAKLDGEYVMLLTVETLAGHYCLYQARARDGLHFYVQPEPFLTGRTHEPALAPYMNVGVRDARITRLEDTYYISYVTEGEAGQRLFLARTADFASAEPVGFVSQVDYKNGVLFPRLFDGRYCMLQRPQEGQNIWISYSRDLEFWGDETVVMAPRDGFWDPNSVGAAGPPIETDQGWL